VGGPGLGYVTCTDRNAITIQQKRFKVMSKSMKVLVLAGILSIAAASGVQAGGQGTSGDFHANAAPACDTDRCPVLADDTGPISAGDHNGRSAALSQGGGEFRVAGGGKVGSDFGH
jgi:hypothetical protein